jgi:periplasmic copper chaperone A
MRSNLCSLLVIVLLASCQQQEPRAIAVEGAWVRLAAVPGRPAAAYFTMKGGETADRLIAIESPKAATVELHQGGMADGMMTMKPMAGADVAAGGETAFAPGGNHAMLFGVDPSIQPGASLPLAFRFQSGKALSAEAKVVAAGDAEPGHAGH